MEINKIATFHSPFTSKFGIPKQSGLVKTLEGQIVFEPKFRTRDALRGIEEFDYLWLIWGFSANRHTATSPVVRPPLLGGNTKMGVFATRSPFRPNALGLSSVHLDHVEWDTQNGPVIVVRGADLMDGTPIYDIKPYITYADCHENARSGFVDQHAIHRLDVEIPHEIENELLAELGDDRLKMLREVLSFDPRPQTQHKPDKTYGMPFHHFDIRFQVLDNHLLIIKEIVKMP